MNLLICFFPLQRKDINDLRVINDTSRLLSTKGDPIITLIAKGNVSRTIGLGEGRKKKKERKKKGKRIRKCENGSGEKVFCLGREHDCRIYSGDLRAPCFYEYTEKTMGNTKLLRSYEASSSQVGRCRRKMAWREDVRIKWGVIKGLSRTFRAENFSNAVGYLFEKYK